MRATMNSAKGWLTFALKERISKGVENVGMMVVSSFNIKPHLPSELRKYEDTGDVVKYPPRVLQLKTEIREMMIESEIKQKKAYNETLKELIQQGEGTTFRMIRYFNETFGKIQTSKSNREKAELEVIISCQGLYKFNLLGEQYLIKWDSGSVGENSHDRVAILADSLVRQVWGLEYSEDDIRKAIVKSSCEQADKDEFEYDYGAEDEHSSASEGEYDEHSHRESDDSWQFQSKFSLCDFMEKQEK
ncbi:hypothetical protein HDV01_004935 [Terramyces sp. JEL0728]|nr:hypothetical protein HDV01_004935 [Terramyces sp. JEL0728]